MATVRKIFGSCRTAFGSSADTDGDGAQVAPLQHLAGAALSLSQQSAFCICWGQGLSAFSLAATTPASAWKGSSTNSKQATRRRKDGDMGFIIPRKYGDGTFRAEAFFGWVPV
jgi:hypothetical protein